MTFDGLLTGFDDRLKSEWLPVRVLSRMGFSHGKLSDAEAKKVEACLSFGGGQGVRDSRFLRV